MTTLFPGTALVTGASSGIGAEYAKRLAERGHDLVLVARDRRRLSEVAARVRSESGRAVEILEADLGDREALGRVEARLTTDASITLLVNNAGTAALNPLLNSDVEQMSDMIELNVTALMRLTYAAVPRFVAQSGGTIINISSVASIAPERQNGVYGATKAFVTAFSQSLQHELASMGVRIQVVLPGATATEIWAKSGKPVETLPQHLVMRADDLVEAALIGLDRGEFLTVPPLFDDTSLKSWEAARQEMISRLSSSLVAPRYRS